MTRFALAQHDFPVGAIDRNVERIAALAEEVRDRHGAELVLFPELAISGYPAEDLLFRDEFIRQCDAAVERLRTVQGIDLVFGAPRRTNGELSNAAIWMRDGEILAEYAKRCLPNYAVFDEKRYFRPGAHACVVERFGLRIAPLVCEDIWEDEPAQGAAEAGANFLLILNASPFHQVKEEQRIERLEQICGKFGLPLLYCNMAGGQDELVFDGGSLAISCRQSELAPAAPFAPELLCVDYADGAFEPVHWPGARLDSLDRIYRALVIGTRDYIRKNGFSKVVIGLSGGIDSAAVLAIAVDAIGAENVLCVMLPSRHTSELSKRLAKEQAEMLAVQLSEISIESAYQAFLDELEPFFAGAPEDITEENIQSRARGVILMAISNKTGRLLLTTGNKSEYAVGYATIYGDMAGGFAPIKDVSKTLLYELSDYLNSHGKRVHREIIDRAPSAELAPNQRDEDSLPPYDVLDPIIARFVEHDESIDEIVAAGFARETVKQVVRLVLSNEYKRRQSAPGVRVTERAFGRDRRYPMTNLWRPHNG